MTLQELQAKLNQEKANQQAQQIAEFEKKMCRQITLQTKLYSYLPKVNEWLKMLNMIHASGTKMFSLSRQMLCSDCIPTGSWEMLTDGVAHRFGIYGATLYKNFSMCAVPQTFDKMGCDGGGCDGKDIWTDGVDWYIGDYRFNPKMVKGNIVNEYKMEITIRRIQDFERYFNQCLETLGN